MLAERFLPNELFRHHLKVERKYMLYTGMVHIYKSNWIDRSSAYHTNSFLKFYDPGLACLYSATVESQQ